MEPLTAVILASGMGERLKPLTDTLNKHMIVVGGMPVLEHVIRNCVDNGIGKLVLCVGIKRDQVMDYFRGSYSTGGNSAKIEYSISDSCQETAGEIAKARRFLTDEEDFLVHYGDAITNLDLRAFYGFHKERGKPVTQAVMDWFRLESGTFTRRGKELQFEEKPLVRIPGRFSNVPVYWMSDRIWQHPQIAFGKDLNYDVIKDMTERGLVEVYNSDIYHFDIGNHKNMRMADAAFREGRQYEVRKLA